MSRLVEYFGGETPGLFLGTRLARRDMTLASLENEQNPFHFNFDLGAPGDGRVD